MNSDPWIDLYERAEEETKSDSLLHHLHNVDVRYLNLGSAGSGAMKEVIRTEDRATGRLIAKATLIDPQNEKAVESFLREARITAHLQHPNIVPIYDIGLDERDRPYFTMKLIKGDNLERILKKLQDGDEEYWKNYPPSRLIDIFIKVCEATAYSHSERVIHLDLKPDNIQVSNFGDVAVCDWGLATLLDKKEDGELSPNDILFFDNRYKTLTGEIKGTPGYMAPEQTKGSKGVKDQRTDIFALGCIFYQILTQRLAIRGKSLERIIENTQEGNITLPSKRRPDLSIPTSLEAVCMKALQLKPENRYQQVQDLIDDIEAYRSGFATAAEKTSLLNQLKLFYNRNKTFCLMSLTFSLIIITMAVLFINRIKEKEEVASSALAELKSQQELNKEIGKSASKIYADKAEKAYLAFNSEAAEALADLSLVLDSKNRKSLEYKGKLLFVKQKFNSAYEHFKETKNDFFDDLTAFCEKVGKSDEPGKIKIQQLLPLVQKNIKKQRYALIGHLLSNAIMIQNEEKIIKDLKWYISQFNSREKINLTILKRPSGYYKFNLAGNVSLKSVNCLRSLPIEILDISGTGVRKIDFASKEKGFKHLRQIILNKNQLNGKNLAYAQDNFKLIFK